MICGLSTAVAVVLALLSPGALAGGLAHGRGGRDVLYVGDGRDNSVKRFDARTGVFLGDLVSTPAEPEVGVDLIGPRGLVLAGRRLLVANQNVGTPINGEVRRYDARTGALLLPPLVPPDSPDAPFAPRGMVLEDRHLFVADAAGRVQRYGPGRPPVALTLLPPPPQRPAFHPRGVVIGPDGLLYVSSTPDPQFLGNGGQVLRFDPRSGAFAGVFVDNAGGSSPDGCSRGLNRPEGLVFGPDGNLYATGYRADAANTDKILVFAGPKSKRPGACLGWIDLDRAGGPRAVPQALLFGPGDDLFVPITNALPPTAPAQDGGAVRRYRLRDGWFRAGHQPPFIRFVRPSAHGGPLGQPWYLTFGKTDPGTLAYRAGRRHPRREP